MTGTGINTAREYFQAVQNGDMQTVGRLLDEEVIWHQPGSNRFSGDHLGREAVFAMLRGMMEASQGTFAVGTAGAFMTNGDLVTAAIRFAGRRGEVTMAMDGVDLLRIKDGKIIEVWLFSTDQAREDAFWGP
ncbi:nuclear transport factor 2 family protein [Streptomyces sp. NPDC008121]|uniref:nuclear transport factor 2 family protein n=1 Tax=Streptomyces sp. NPDC008121 TaxID=3364809 RepID=UPI0036EE61B3